MGFILNHFKVPSLKNFATGQIKGKKFLSIATLFEINKFIILTNICSSMILYAIKVIIFVDEFVKKPVAELFF